MFIYSSFETENKPVQSICAHLGKSHLCKGEKDQNKVSHYQNTMPLHIFYTVLLRNQIFLRVKKQLHLN